MLVFGGVRRYIEIGNVFVSRGHRFVIYTPKGAAPSWLEFKGETASFDSLDSSFHDVLMTGSPEYTCLLDRAQASLKVFYLQIKNVEGEKRIVRSGRYAIMVNSSGLARRVRRRYSIDVLDGIGGVDPRLFHPVELEKAVFQEDEKEYPASMKVLCYGRLSRPRKGTRHVINAAGYLYRRGYNIQLHLFDSSTGDDVVARKGFDPGLPFRYYTALPQKCMAAMYGCADVFVSAERRAGWSNTAAEAAACGLPLICTRSGTSDFATDGESALVLPARNRMFIIKALKKLYNDRGLGLALGRKARGRVMEYSWERVCDRMEAGFSRLLGRA